MAISLAFMFSAAQYFLASFTTLKNSSILTTSRHSLSLTTVTFYQSTFMLTRATHSAMANIWTKMRTKFTPFSLTWFTARMGFEIPIIIRVFKLSTKTIILWHGFVILIFALYAGPTDKKLLFNLIFALICFLYPLFYTFQVE